MALTSQATFAQSDSKMGLSIGLNTDTYSPGLGATINYDYFISEKFTVGVKAMYHKELFDEFWDDETMFLANANVQYYFLNGPTQEGFGLYAGAGAGYKTHFYRYTGGYGGYDLQETTYSGLAGHFSGGSKYTLGNGNLFAEFTYQRLLSGQVKFEDGFTSNYSEELTGKADNTLLISVGYQILF